MKKIIAISLMGPVLIIIQRTLEILYRLNELGLQGTYECAVATYQPCSFFTYAFQSEMTIYACMAMILSFITLLLGTSYVMYLMNLYKSNKRKLFWSLLWVTIIIAVELLYFKVFSTIKFF